MPVNWGSMSGMQDRGGHRWAGSPSDQPRNPLFRCQQLAYFYERDVNTVSQCAGVRGHVDPCMTLDQFWRLIAAESAKQEGPAIDYQTFVRGYNSWLERNVI